MSDAERALLIELAKWITRLEEGLARDNGTPPGRVAETLRRLIAEISEVPAAP
jgi:hypothetical protein